MEQRSISSRVMLYSFPHPSLVLSHSFQIMKVACILLAAVVAVAVAMPYEDYVREYNKV